MRIQTLREMGFEYKAIVAKIAYKNVLGLNNLNALDSKGNYSATSNNTKLVHWPLMGGLFTLQRGEALTGWDPAQSPPDYTKRYSPPIKGRCTDHRIAIWWSVALRFNVAIKRLN